MSKTLSELIINRISEVERENKKLVENNSEYTEVKALLQRLGINSPGEWRIREKLEAYKTGFPDDLKYNLESAKNLMNSLTKTIDEIKKALCETEEITHESA